MYHYLLNITYWILYEQMQKIQQCSNQQTLNFDPPDRNCVLSFNQQTSVKMWEMTLIKYLIRSSQSATFKVFYYENTLLQQLTFHALFTLKLRVEACSIKPIYTRWDNVTSVILLTSVE